MYTYYVTCTHVYVCISGPSNPTANLLVNTIKETRFSINVSVEDKRFNHFSIIYCSQDPFAICQNTTVDQPENGLNMTVELTDLVEATFYNVLVYTVLPNGLSSTPANITGRTGS